MGLTFMGRVGAALLGALLFSAPALAQDFEYDTNRRGLDFRDFDLASPDPGQCRSACLQDGRCRAYTYVKPGVQGAGARCWLKADVPPPSADGCCVSGIKGGFDQAGLERGINRRGGDYRNFDLERPDPTLCRNACLDDGQCQAFTYTQPGVQGPGARCWLKNTVPVADRDDCCVSGVRSGGGGGGGAIQVIEATYGPNCRIPRGNATSSVANACNGRGQCRYVVDVNVLGDPANGCAKEFEVTWRCGAGSSPRSTGAPGEAGWGSAVELKC